MASVKHSRLIVEGMRELAFVLIPPLAVKREPWKLLAHFEKDRNRRSMQYQS
jgi:hypothetical protein